LLLRVSLLLLLSLLLLVVLLEIWTLVPPLLWWVKIVSMVMYVSAKVPEPAGA
jgi:hypothetical protein